MTLPLQEALASRLAAVETRLTAACTRAGRQRAEVTLVAVTKYVPDEVVTLLPQLGVVNLGESRPQELWRRVPLLPSSVCWHLIGHLQRNKVERTVPLVHMIHSVDSRRLLQELIADTAQRGLTVSVLLEVNAANDPNKHGFALDDIPPVLNELDEVHSVTVCGLMTMAALSDDPEASRPRFRGAA